MEHRRRWCRKHWGCSSDSLVQMTTVSASMTAQLHFGKGPADPRECDKDGVGCCMFTGEATSSAGLTWPFPALAIQRISSRDYRPDLDLN